MFKHSLNIQFRPVKKICMLFPELARINALNVAIG